MKSISEPQTHTLRYGDHTHTYTITEQDRKTIRLTVYPDLSIKLFSPLGYPHEKIEKFIKRKDAWIRKQLRELKRLQRSRKPKEYISGESHLYLGRQYRLLVVENSDPMAVGNVRFENGRIVITTDPHLSNQELLEAWYCERAAELFPKRYKAMLPKFNCEPPQLVIRTMKTRWGSYTSKKRVILNTELIKAAKECIDYVIIHELCHIKHQNHSKEYYRHLSSKCPNWKQLKEKLEMRFAGI